MILSYWLTLAVGFGTLILWIFLQGMADADAWARLDPEVRFPQAKLVVAGLVGFGIAGLSSSYGGWGAGFSIGAAAVGAGAAAWYAATVEPSGLPEDEQVLVEDPPVPEA